MMDGAITKRRVVVVIGAALLITASLLTAACTSTGSEADYNTAYQTGLEAYTYGLPLLVTNATFSTMTSVDVSNGAFGPVNRFNNVRSLNNPGSTAVVAPGSSALSSIAWLDLRTEPQVLHVPEVSDHFFVLAFVDPYTTNFLNFGTINQTPPGDYVVVGPGQHTVSVPAGTHRIDVEYNRIWIIGSTQLKGSNDVANVTRIQDGYTLTPLSQYGTEYQPKNVTDPRTTVRTYQIPGGVEFFDQLGQQLAEFPPPQADQPAILRFAGVGIGPGMAPSRNTQLSKDTLRGLADAVAAGPAQIRNDTQSLFLAGFDRHNGYLVGGFGQYGTDYRTRAVISQIGLGAMSSDQAIFAMSWADATKTPLNGSARYVLHLASVPPTNEGWSFTAYDLNGTLIPNPINRYALTSASPLSRNADGSVDIYVQSTQPSDAAQATNWLPTANGQGFEIMWRLLAPKPAEIQGILDGTGWQPPAISIAP
jgi:hypothetical protein